MDLLLAIARRAVLALGAVDEGGIFGVEAVEAIWVLVDVGVVLGYELPAYFAGDDVTMGSRGGGGWCRAV